MSNSQGYEVKCEAPRTLKVLNAESCQALSSPNKNHDFTATQGNCYSLNKWLCKRFRYDRRRTRNLVTCYPTTRNSLTRIRLHKYKLKSGLWCQILINGSQNTNSSRSLNASGKFSPACVALWFATPNRSPGHQAIQITGVLSRNI